MVITYQEVINDHAFSIHKRVVALETRNNLYERVPFFN